MRSQIRQEILDKAINNCNQVMQGWEQRFRLSSPNFAERFDSGRQDVIIHLRSSPNPEEIYVARFVKEAVLLSTRSPIAYDDLCDIQDQPVLTKIVELVKQTKSLVTARVRLYALDEFYGVRMNQLFYSLQTGFVTGLIVREREINVPKVVFGGVGSVIPNKLESKMVKSPYQVADAISSSTQRIKGNLIGVDSPVRALERLNLSLGAMGISAELVEGGFHIDQVLFGPLDLGANQG